MYEQAGGLLVPAPAPQYLGRSPSDETPLTDRPKGSPGLPRPPLRIFSALALAVASLASLSVLTAAPAGAAVLPPANPANNPPPANLLRDCYPPVNASACSTDAVAAIDTARAREGVGPIVLPSNFAALGAPEQVL